MIEPKVEQWMIDALDDLYQSGYLYLGIKDRPKPKEIAASIIARHAPATPPAAVTSDAIEHLCNAWLEQAENLAREHCHDDAVENWDDDEAHGAYRTLIDCRAALSRTVPTADTNTVRELHNVLINIREDATRKNRASRDQAFLLNDLENIESRVNAALSRLAPQTHGETD